jgi:pilus assembly protein Flp/PilA
MLSHSQGATAVEFALVCAPFLALLGATIQTAFSIWATQNFEYQFQKTARTLFTGQFQQANSQSADSATLLAAFKSAMCGSGSATTMTVFDCSNIKIDISLGTNFASSTPIRPVDPTTRDWSSGFGSHYACAGPSTIVVATAAVKFPVFFGALNRAFSSFADGSQLLMSTSVFRTEPYTAGSSPC